MSYPHQTSSKASSLLLHSLLVIGLIISIILVWGHEYYMTCDGAMHTYASSIFNQWFGNGHSFYSAFLDYNVDLDPNRLIYWMMSPLLHVFSPATTDKIIISIYLIGLPLSIRYLGSHHNLKTGTLAALMSIPLSFNMCFMQGFYNYLYGVFIVIICMGYYIRHYHQMGLIRMLILCILLLIATLAHGMPFNFFLIFAGSLIFLTSHSIRVMVIRGLRLVPIIIPSYTIIYLFGHKRGLDMSTIGEFAERNWHDFTELSTLNLYAFDENIVHRFLAWFIMAITIISIYLLLRNKHIRGWYIYIMSAMIMMIIYLVGPDIIMGAGGFNIRMQFVVYLFMILFIAQMFSQYRYVYYTVGLIISLVIVIDATSRWAKLGELSDYVADVMSASSVVHDGDVIINIHFNDWGRWPGGNENILKWDNSLMHEELYLCAGQHKNVLAINNFQFFNNYFLFYWNKLCDVPRFCGYPNPSLSLAEMKNYYPLNKINKIILINPSPEEMKEWKMKNSELLSDYDLIWASPKGIEFVYGLKKINLL